VGRNRCRSAMAWWKVELKFSRAPKPISYDAHEQISTKAASGLRRPLPLAAEIPSRGLVARLLEQIQRV
jgi:hypothetical protein